MIVARIENADAVLGKSQGYIPLPIRIEPYGNNAAGEEQITMVSAWTPTPAEVEAIKAGANIHVRLFCVEHPPIIVSVGRPPGVDVFHKEPLCQN